MPVTACPDCGHDVSTLAPACPHCGRPMSAIPPVLQPPAAATGAEETLWRGTPSPKVLIGRVAGLIVILVAIPWIAHWAASNTQDLDKAANLIKIGWWVTAVVFVVQLIRLGIALMRIRSTLYTITNQRIMIEHGILSKSLSEIDLRTIDDTQFFQSLTARILGIGNVTLISTDKEAPVLVLHNIHDPRALRELIRSNAYRMSQRQLYTRQA
jgi:membrane protein YdbS with pleckstrin-like domain